MMADRDNLGTPRGSKKLVWILPVLLMVLLVILSLYGIGGGLGEAVGVEEAAPGDTNAATNPATDIEG